MDINKIDENNIDQKAEQELLALVINNGSKYPAVSWLKSAEFYFEEHQIIWKSIQRLHKDKQEINQFSVYEKVKDQNNLPLKDEYLNALFDAGLSLATLSYYAKRIRKKSIERRILEGEVVTKDLLMELLEEEKVDILRMQEIVAKELSEIVAGNHLVNVGYKTGFNNLDKYIGGVKKGDLFILAGRPAMGKTTLALNLALNLSENGVKVLYINLEMSANQLARKIISNKARINSSSFNQLLGESEMKRAMLLGSDCLEKEKNLFLMDKGKITLEEIRGAIKDRFYDVVFIDQLTKVKHVSKRERLDQEIAEITFDLKAMAKEYEMPVVLIHQINREAEKRENKRPLLSDLRDSGAVEQDGDVVLLIHRDSYYTGDESDRTTTIRVAKNKMGETGELHFSFEPEFSKFYEKEVFQVEKYQVGQVRNGKKKFGIEKSYTE